MRVLPVIDEGNRPRGELRATDELLEVLEQCVKDKQVLALSPVYDATTSRLMAMLGMRINPQSSAPHTTRCSDDDCPCWLAGQQDKVDELAEAQGELQQATLKLLRAVTDGKMVAVFVEDLAVALFADGMEATDATKRLRQAVEDA